MIEEGVLDVSEGTPAVSEGVSDGFADSNTRKVKAKVTEGAAPATATAPPLAASNIVLLGGIRQV